MDESIMLMNSGERVRFIQKTHKVRQRVPLSKGGPTRPFLADR